MQSEAKPSIMIEALDYDFELVKQCRHYFEQIFKDLELKNTKSIAPGIVSAQTVEEVRLFTFKSI